eukprot:4740800-Pleurochrysis_carterae.AAC.3
MGFDTRHADDGDHGDRGAYVDGGDCGGRRGGRGVVDDIIGKSVRVTKGAWKGYLGLVKSVNGPQASPATDPEVGSSRLICVHITCCDAAMPGACRVAPYLSCAENFTAGSHCLLQF